MKDKEKAQSAPDQQTGQLANQPTAAQPPPKRISRKAAKYAKEKPGNGRVYGVEILADLRTTGRSDSGA